MATLAKITKNLTKGYSEAMLAAGDYKCTTNTDFSGVDLAALFPADCDRVIVEHTDDFRRDDIIMVTKAKGYETKGARLAYLMVPVMFVLGCFLGKIKAFSLADILLTGAILAFLNFILAWIMNRQARLRRRLQYRATALVQEHGSI